MRDVLKEFVIGELDREDVQSDCSIVCGWLLRKLGPQKVIEIGTSYGRQLSKFVPFASEVVCIDPMYDWVPNVQETEGFDPARVDQKKIEEWERNAKSFREKIKLIVGNSFLVHKDPGSQAALSGADILIIDGCHQPAESVAKDFENFSPLMKPSYYVIWDDIGMADVAKAVEKVSAQASDRLDILNTCVMYFCSSGASGSIPVS